MTGTWMAIGPIDWATLVAPRYPWTHHTPPRERRPRERRDAEIPGYDLRDITRPRALNRDTRPRKRLSMRGETIRERAREVGQEPIRTTPLAHPERPPRTQPLVAKARTRAAKRERPGREARAFTLNLLARQFRARLLK